MNTILHYHNGATLVVHRIIPSDFLESVVHDYRVLTRPIQVEVEPALTLKQKELARMKVLTAKADYKKHSGTPDHNLQRSEFISVVLKARLPRWGGARFAELK